MSLGLSDTPLPSLPEAHIGRLLAGCYRLSAVLGSGAVGVVYAATDLRDGRPLAIKLLAAHSDLGGQALRRFQREGAALRKLDHRNVVKVFDAGMDISPHDAAQDRSVAYIVMERLAGQTLEQRIEQDGALSPQLTEHIARELLTALAYAHGKHVVHRDLKPSNIFLCGAPARPEVKLLDFGLAKFLGVEPPELSPERSPDGSPEGSPDGSPGPSTRVSPAMSQTLTRSGMVLGTPLYMAPEQCAGDRVDARADIYAAGCLLYEMLTGQPPFLADTQADVVRAHLLTPAPPLPGDGEDGARTALSSVVARAMEKQPEDRYADAHAMRAALREAFADKSGGLVKRSVAGMRAPLESRRNRHLLAAALVLIAGLGLVQLRRGAHDDPRAAAEHSAQAGLGGDLFETRGVPEELARLHKRVMAGEGIGQAEITQLRRFAREHRGDPRPYLLLGKGFLNKGWRRDAVVRYRRAFEVDPGALLHAPMLADLIDMAEGDKHAEAAAEAIIDMYGPAAIAPVTAAMNGRPRASPEHHRLAMLAARLAPRAQ